MKYIKVGNDIGICEYNPEESKRLKHIRDRKKVKQYTKNGKFLKEYDSIVIAKKESGCNHISSCCKGKQKYDKGFIWKYS